MKVKMAKQAPKGYTLEEVRLKPNQEFYFSVTPIKHGGRDVGATQATYEFVYKSKGSEDVVKDVSALIPTKKLDGSDNFTNDYFDYKYQMPSMKAKGIVESTKMQPTALLYENEGFKFYKRNNKYYQMDKVSNKEYESNQTEILQDLETQLSTNAR